MLNLPAILKRQKAASKARPQDGVAAMWVRRYREDVPMLVAALQEAQAEIKRLEGLAACYPSWLPGESE